MPARVVVVLDEPGFADKTAVVLAAAGINAAAFADPMAALDALEGAHRVELLVACPDFPQGKPNGIALARMARLKRPDITVLFVGPMEAARHAAGLGEFIPAPISVHDLVNTISDMLQKTDDADRVD
jgi:DNA-binding NtrC family response regulator